MEQQGLPFSGCATLCCDFTYSLLFCGHPFIYLGNRDNDAMLQIGMSMAAMVECFSATGLGKT